MLTQPTNCIKPTSNILFSFNSIPKSFFKLHPPLNPRTLSFKLHCSQYPNPTPFSSSSSPFQPLISILRIIPDWADEIKERGFRQDRTLYDHEKWVHHRSSYRHLRHFLTSLSSRVILSLIPPVIAFTVVAVVIASYNTAVALEWLPEVFPMLRSSALPYQLTAPALALLLVFRTEASYSRFEEGRKAWTKVIAGTNDFARQIISGVENSGDAELKKALLQYVVAFPVALKIPSHVLMGIPHTNSCSPLSPLGEACSRRDLTAVHEILENIGYKDDGMTNELSFQMWTDQMQETLDSKKNGDSAFKQKDFRTAIECYSQFIDIGNMVSPTIFARCSLSYLMDEMPQEAPNDAMQAQVVSPIWHIASYLQAAALSALGMETEAQSALKEGTVLEAKRNTAAGHK